MINLKIEKKFLKGILLKKNGGFYKENLVG